MIYSNLNRYVSRHLLIIYFLFLSTGVLFLWKFNYFIKADPDIVVFTDTVEVYIDTVKNHKMFLNEISKYESGNNYRVVNRLGYLGKYQFGKRTLGTLKIKCTTQEFLTQPDLQEYAMDEYLRYNKKKLRYYIGKYQFTHYKGIFITESGILAAAHLGGPNSVKRFFDTGRIFKDGNGMPITKYMKIFKGYTLNFK